MNNVRRKQLEKLKERIEDIKNDLSFILEEEQESFDNIPESLQEGENGAKSQSAIDAMESADSSLDEVIDYLNTSIE